MWVLKGGGRVAGGQGLGVGRGAATPGKKVGFESGRFGQTCHHNFF